MTRARRAWPLLTLGLAAASCLRAPIVDDGGVDAVVPGTDGPDSDDLGGSGPLDGSDTTHATAGETTTEGDGTTADPQAACHPSYLPCLPVVDDLNCPDVVALGAAPVTVIGPDEYGLDADGDGIGCET
ncbi:MAG: hypothetical protein AB1Z98_12385 [Nannocystaceae bacterium]